MYSIRSIQFYIFHADDSILILHHLILTILTILTLLYAEQLYLRFCNDNLILFYSIYVTDLIMTDRTYYMHLTT
jgi:hypothetical protein